MKRESISEQSINITTSSSSIEDVNDLKRMLNTSGDHNDDSTATMATASSSTATSSSSSADASPSSPPPSTSQSPWESLLESRLQAFQKIELIVDNARAHAKSVCPRRPFQNNSDSELYCSDSALYYRPPGFFWTGTEGGQQPSLSDSLCSPPLRHKRRLTSSKNNRGNNNCYADSNTALTAPDLLSSPKSSRARQHNQFRQRVQEDNRWESISCSPMKKNGQLPTMARLGGLNDLARSGMANCITNASFAACVASSPYSSSSASGGGSPTSNSMCRWGKTECAPPTKPMRLSAPPLVEAQSSSSSSASTSSSSSARTDASPTSIVSFNLSGGQLGCSPSGAAGGGVSNGPCSAAAGAAATALGVAASKLSLSMPRRPRRRLSWDDDITSDNEFHGASTAEMISKVLEELNIADDEDEEHLIVDDDLDLVDSSDEEDNNDGEEDDDSESVDDDVDEEQEEQDSLLEEEEDDEEEEEEELSCVAVA